MAALSIEHPSEADFDVIHAALTETYWSPGISREIVARSFRNSMAVLARDNGALIGWARVVTDKATFAWVCDVWVAPSQRGRGLGRALVQSLRAHPDLQNLRRWILGTRDAHGVYAELGFRPIAAPDRLMEIRLSAPYGIAI